MARKSIHGIFLAVELDKAALEKVSTDLLQEMEKTNKRIHKQAAIKPRLDSSSMQKSLEGLLTSLLRIKEHANNVNQVFDKLPAILNSGNMNLQNQFKLIGKSLDMTRDKFKGIFEKAFKAGEIRNVVSAFEGLKRGANMTNEEILHIAENMRRLPSEALEALRMRYEKTANTLRSSFDMIKNSSADMAKSKDLLFSTMNMDTLLKKYPHLNDEIQKIGNSARVSKDQVIQFMKAMLQKEGIDGLISSLKIHQQITGKTDAQIREMVANESHLNIALNAVNKAFSSQGATMDALNARIQGITERFTSVKTALQSIKDVKYISSASPQIKELASALGITDKQARKLAKQMILIGNEKSIISFFTRLKSDLNKSDGYILKLAESCGVSKRALKQLEAQLKTMSQATQTAGQGFSFFNQILMGLGINASIAGLGALIKSAYDTSVKMNTLTVAFQAVEGSSAAASAKLGFIRKESEALGLNFEETAKAAKTFYAAANLSPVAKEGDKIFHAFSEAATALHLSKEETSGMFLAISQMMSKGKITAEELRLQLAERLPGAVQLLAKAMKVSTMELDKMLKDGKVGIENLVLLAEEAHKQYGVAAKNASNSVVAELNRVSNAWFNFKQEFNLAENMAFALSIIKSLINALTATGRTLANLAITLGALRVTGRGTFIILSKLALGLKAFKASIFVSGMKMATTAVIGFTTGTLNAVKAGHMLVKAFNVHNLAKLVGISAATAGWAALGVTIAAVAGSLIYWYKSANRASKELQELEKNYESLKNSSKAGIEIEVNGVKLKKEAVEEQIGKEIQAIQDFVNKHKIEWSISENKEKFKEQFKELEATKEKLKELEDELVNLSDNWAGGSASLDAYRNSLEQQIEKLKAHIESSKLATSAVEDFQKAGFDLAQTVREGLMTQEEANEKLEDAKNKALKAADGNAELQAAINALYTPLQTLIGQCDAVAVAMGGMAQMARIAKLEMDRLSGVTALSAINRRVAMLQDKEALMKEHTERGIQEAQAIGGEHTRQLISKNSSLSARREAAALLVTQNAPLQAAANAIYNTEAPQEYKTVAGVIKIKNKNYVRDKAAYDKLLASAPLPKTATLGEKESPLEGAKRLVNAASSDPSLASFLDNISAGVQAAAEAGDREQKILDNINALKHPKKSKTKKTPKAKKEKSTMAQDKKDRGVDDTLVALKEEKELLERIQKIGEDNTVARSFLEIEQSVIKARKAAAKYEKDNMNATNQAKVAEAAKLMIENAKIKAKTKEIKLLEDEKKKALELISTYNQESGLPDAEGIQLINDAYEKQIRELDSLIERYEKLGMTSQADIAKKAKETAEKNNEKQLLFKETGVEASVKQALLAYDEANANVTEKMKSLWVDSITTMGDSLADFISSGLTGFSDLGEAFKELASSMLKDMTRIMMHQFVRYMIQGMFGNSIPFGGGGGGFATGGVLSGGNISSYRNTIVSQPTSFSYGSQRFAKGGIMGEAGPEAVMPLTRTADGNLGVRSVGSNGNDSGDNVTVNVYNYGNEKAKTRSSKDAHGGRTIDVIIGDIAAQQMTTPGTKLNRTVTAQTGSSQPVIRR